MQSEETACEEGEHEIKKLKSRHTSPHPINSQKQTSNSIKPSSSLINSGTDEASVPLEELVKRERLRTLILNLYPKDKGYSFAFWTSFPSNSVDDTANMFEIAVWPYIDDDIIFKYIENQQVPPFLRDIFYNCIDLIDLYNDCIILEIRDYRYQKNSTLYALLRPTQVQNVVINKTQTDRLSRTANDNLQRESQVLTSRYPDLDLNTDNSIQQPQLPEHSDDKQTARKIEKRKRLHSSSVYKHGSKVYDFISMKKHKEDVKDLKSIPIPNLDVPRLSLPKLLPDDEFKECLRPTDTTDKSQLFKVYDLRSNEKDKSQANRLKLSIWRRPSTSEYFGEFYLNRDYKDNERNGVACRFSLGSLTNVNRYIQQLSEFFNLEDQKPLPTQFNINLAPRHPDQNQIAVVNASLGLVHTTNIVQNTSNNPILQRHLQGNPQIKFDGEKRLLVKQIFKRDVFEPNAATKQQQQLISNENKTAIINPSKTFTRALNSDGSAVTVNIYKSSQIFNNNIENSILRSQPITYTTVNSGNCVNFKQETNQRSNVNNISDSSSVGNNKLPEVLEGTSTTTTTTTNRTEIVGATTTNSLLTTKLPNTTNNINQPIQTSGYIQIPNNFMNLNPAQFQFLAQISSSSNSNVQGDSSLMVPATSNANTIIQVDNRSFTPVVLENAHQLMPGVKTISQQFRPGAQQAMSLTAQGCSTFQNIIMSRSRTQQQTTSNQQNLGPSKTIQRTSNTKPLKMAGSNANAPQQNVTVTSHLQKQHQQQQQQHQYQQFLFNQNILARRRRSNTNEPE